jgi:hypothetical protein
MFARLLPDYINTQQLMIAPDTMIQGCCFIKKKISQRNFGIY